MAYELPLQPFSLVASADLSSSQFRFVKMSGNNTITVCSVDGEKAIGVLQNNPTSGRVATVEVGSGAISKVVIAASETLVAGDLVGTTTAGTATKIDPTSTGADLGDYILGEVIEGGTGSSPASVLATIIFRPQGRVTA